MYENTCIWFKQMFKFIHYVNEEGRVFNNLQLDARRCAHETFTKVQATEVFFVVTNIFQSKDNIVHSISYNIWMHPITGYSDT